jgi:hypothetical protein
MNDSMYLCVPGKNERACFMIFIHNFSLLLLHEAENHQKERVKVADERVDNITVINLGIFTDVSLWHAYWCCC